jgi:hypothetical protein
MHDLDVDKELETLIRKAVPFIEIDTQILTPAEPLPIRSQSTELVPYGRSHETALAHYQPNTIAEASFDIRVAKLFEVYRLTWRHTPVMFHSPQYQTEVALQLERLVDELERADGER